MQNKPCGLHCIKAKNISVIIGKEEILKNINLHIHCGELTVIIGRNGAGKSTLLKAMLGEIKHTGDIDFVDMKNNTTKKLKIGYVPQSLNIEKHMPTTVYDFIAALISNKPIWLKKDKELYQKIKRHLNIFECEKLIDKSIGDLSRRRITKSIISSGDNRRARFINFGRANIWNR